MTDPKPRGYKNYCRASSEISPKLARAFSPHNCCVREHTHDGQFVGRCDFYVGEGPKYECPRHGDVTDVQTEYIATGRSPKNADDRIFWRRAR